MLSIPVVQLSSSNDGESVISFSPTNLYQVVGTDRVVAVDYHARQLASQAADEDCVMLDVVGQQPEYVLRHDFEKGWLDVVNATTYRVVDMSTKRFELAAERAGIKIISIRGPNWNRVRGPGAYSDYKYVTAAPVPGCERWREK